MINNYDLLHAADSYDYFYSRNTMRGAFHSNKAELIELQEAIRLPVYKAGSLINEKPYVGLFVTNEDTLLKSDALSKDDEYLTHPKYSDGTVMAEAMFAIGDLEANADLRRRSGILSGQTTLGNHAFTDLLRKKHLLDQ